MINNHSDIINTKQIITPNIYNISTNIAQGNRLAVCSIPIVDEYDDLKLYFISVI